MINDFLRNDGVEDESNNMIDVETFYLNYPDSVLLDVSTIRDRIGLDIIKEFEKVYNNIETVKVKNPFFEECNAIVINEEYQADIEYFLGIDKYVFGSILGLLDVLYVREKDIVSFILDEQITTTKQEEGGLIFNFYSIFPNNITEQYFYNIDEKERLCYIKYNKKTDWTGSGLEIIPFISKWCIKNKKRILHTKSPYFLPYRLIDYDLVNNIIDNESVKTNDIDNLFRQVMLFRYKKDIRDKNYIKTKDLSVYLSDNTNDLLLEYEDNDKIMKCPLREVYGIKWDKKEMIDKIYKLALSKNLTMLSKNVRISDKEKMELDEIYKDIKNQNDEKESK